MRASGLLKADWDPAKHPRWPAGSPGGIGGEFAPAGVASDSGADADSASGDAVSEPTVPVIPAEFYPRSNLKNPFPDRPECEEEWAHALKYCTELMRSGRMGRDGVRGFGRTFQQCVLGLVSEDCGGSLRS